MIEIDPRDEATRRLWNAVAELVEMLPTGWVLVGGLMVQLHALERGDREVRPTVDIDVLGQARPQGTIATIDEACGPTASSSASRIWMATPSGTCATT